MLAQPRERWSLRRETNLVYTVFPSAQLLIQEDHVVWVQVLPVAPDRTTVRIATLAPADFDSTNDEAALHWRKNHDISVRTLAEDFAIGESIQGGLPSGANDELRFGRFEGALDRFNRIVEREIIAGAPHERNARHRDEFGRSRTSISPGSRPRIHLDEHGLQWHA